MTDRVDRTLEKQVSGDRLPATFIYMIMVVAIVALDQVIKVFVRKNLVLGEQHKLIGDLFSITYIENTGAAFSSFSGYAVFLIVTTGISLALVFYLLFKTAHEKRPLFGISLALIGGGGIGNLIDRIRFESVTDYFDLKYFAIFNLADIAITLGAVLIIIYMLWLDDGGRHSHDR